MEKIPDTKTGVRTNFWTSYQGKMSYFRLVIKLMYPGNVGDPRDSPIPGIPHEFGVGRGFVSGESPGQGILKRGPIASLKKTFT